MSKIRWVLHLPLLVLALLLLRLARICGKPGFIAAGGLAVYAMANAIRGDARS